MELIVAEDSTAMKMRIVAEWYENCSYIEILKSNFIKWKKIRIIMDCYEYSYSQFIQ